MSLIETIALASHFECFFLAAIPKRSHPFPSRTRKLSSSGPMVLQGQPCGRVGRCRGFEGPLARVGLRLFRRPAFFGAWACSPAPGLFRQTKAADPARLVAVGFIVRAMKHTSLLVLFGAMVGVGSVAFAQGQDFDK